MLQGYYHGGMRRSADPLYVAADSSLELGRLGLRVLAGRRLPRRWRRVGLVVVASDIDAEAGVAAVWFVRTVRRPRREEVCRYERVAGDWQYTTGAGGNDPEFAATGRMAAAVAGQASMLTHLGGTAARSSADRQAQGDQLDPSRAGFAAHAMFRVASEVTCLLVGARRVPVPGHGHVVIAWKAPPADRPRRPPIAALGADGKILSELGPDDHLDTLSWAAIEKATGQE
jgi:hypothetical protein